MEVTGHCVILGRPPAREPSRNWTLTLQSLGDLAGGGDANVGWSGGGDLFLGLKDWDNRGLDSQFIRFSYSCTVCKLGSCHGIKYTNAWWQSINIAWHIGAFEQMCDLCTRRSLMVRERDYMYPWRKIKLLCNIVWEASQISTQMVLVKMHSVNSLEGEFTLIRITSKVFIKRKSGVACLRKSRTQ